MKTSILGLAFVIAGICLLLPSDWYRATLLVAFGTWLILFAEDAEKQPSRNPKEDFEFDTSLSED